MDILADDISKNDYKINIGLEPHEGKRCLHVKVNAPDHIMDADPTDKETNSKLLTSWMERITKHILESFSDLDPDYKNDRIYLRSCNIIINMSDPATIGWN